VRRFTKGERADCVARLHDDLDGDDCRFEKVDRVFARRGEGALVGGAEGVSSVVERACRDEDLGDECARWQALELSRTQPTWLSGR
jgi:hypothetical protein